MEEKLVRRGDPAFLLEWFEKHPMDEEYADIVDEIVAESRRKFRLKKPRKSR
ncbi:MAG: hypothetical protein HY558_01820 [Euryarchaeota archaeon]|nr:hypothetical protein [Euryarchaeota archaeon]